MVDVGGTWCGQGHILLWLQYKHDLWRKVWWWSGTKWSSLVTSLWGRLCPSSSRRQSCVQWGAVVLTAACWNHTSPARKENSLVTLPSNPPFWGGGLGTCHTHTCMHRLIRIYSSSLIPGPLMVWEWGWEWSAWEWGRHGLGMRQMWFGNEVGSGQFGNEPDMVWEWGGSKMYLEWV